MCRVGGAVSAAAPSTQCAFSFFAHKRPTEQRQGRHVQMNRLQSDLASVASDRDRGFLCDSPWLYGRCTAVAVMAVGRFECMRRCPRDHKAGRPRGLGPHCSHSVSACSATAACDPSWPSRFVRRARRPARWLEVRSPECLFASAPGMLVKGDLTAARRGLLHPGPARMPRSSSRH